MTFEKVRDMLAEHLDKDANDITMESTFESLGLDSLDTVELVMEIEDAFEISIEMDTNLETVADLVAVIDGEKAE
ncbi:MAG: acyl carrier protein [Christensenellaceae bacterium]|jgi:acyl carrier protein